MPFFIEPLQVSGRFDPWVESCPLVLKSPNGPSKRDVLGTALLSILCGHRRYAHISALRGDNLNAPLLGMEGVVSEDSVRRNLGKIDEAEGVKWLQAHLDGCVAPVLGIPWILDVDVTVKPLYGHQQGAVKGYNPHKPRRPSHTYPTYFIANLRLVLDVEAQAGDQSASAYSSPGLWALLGRLPRGVSSGTLTPTPSSTRTRKAFRENKRDIQTFFEMSPRGSGAIRHPERPYGQD